MSEITRKYDLGEIHGLIRDRDLNINYGGRSETDSVNIGYFDDDVKQCLLSLTDDDYTGTVKYPQGRIIAICDEYEIDYFGPNQCIDELYIKFKYSPRWLTLMSFHLRKYG